MLVLGVVIVACVVLIIYILKKTQNPEKVQSAFTDQADKAPEKPAPPAKL